jgi:antitoxin MazE
VVKKLVPHGDGLALVFDGPILDLLKIDAETPIEVSTDRGRLVLTPQNGPEGSDFRHDLEEFSDEYANMLKRLAD